MNLKITTFAIVLVTVLLLAQTVSVVEAHHKTEDNGEIRTSAETKSESYDEQGNLKTTIDERRTAFLAWKTAFNAWKTAKEEYKAAKITEVQTTIDAKKIILDAALITKENAWKTYQDTKKNNAR